MTTNVNLLPLGFIPPVIRPEEFTFAGKQFTGSILNKKRDWTNYLPKTELQHNNRFDTNSCFIYGSLNQIETMLEFHTGKDYNYSERFNAYYSDWTPYGGNPHNVYQSVRHNGLVPEELLPFNERIDKSNYILKKMPYILKKKGMSWLNEWELQHDWLILPNDTKKHDLIMEGLLYCPIAASVTAWIEKDGIYTKNKGEHDNHWGLIFNTDEKENYLFYDTYNKTIKTLERGYDFGYAKRISLENIEGKENWIIQFIHSLWGR